MSHEPARGLHHPHGGVSPASDSPTEASGRTRLQVRGWLSLGAFICQMGLKHKSVLGCWGWEWSRGWGTTGPGQEAGAVGWLASPHGARCVSVAGGWARVGGQLWLSLNGREFHGRQSCYFWSPQPSGRSWSPQPHNRLPQGGPGLALVSLCALPYKKAGTEGAGERASKCESRGQDQHGRAPAARGQEARSGGPVWEGASLARAASPSVCLGELSGEFDEDGFCV